MSKRPSASEITKGLAKLGGGTIKEGGKGMQGGMEKILQKGVEIGYQKRLMEEKNSGIRGLIGKIIGKK